jgi:hypothetical protein
MADLEPLIDSIAKLIGVTSEVAPRAVEEATAAAKRPALRPAVGRAVTGVAPQAEVPPTGGPQPRSKIDVEKWLGESLKTDPVNQAVVVHDYLRGASALDEAAQTGATHVRQISIPVWEATQRQLQQRVDADPEVQEAIRRLYIGRNTSADPTVTSRVIPDPSASTESPSSSTVVSDDATKFSSRPVIAKAPSAETVRTRNSAWQGLAEGVEAQNPDVVAQALEQIHALEPAYAKAVGTAEKEMTPVWQEAIQYMLSLEQKAAEMQQSGVTHEQWRPMLDDFRKQLNINYDDMPPRVRRTVQRVEAWADSAKPASAGEVVGQIAGVPRALMSSFDLSAPGRQGLLMISRPEFWHAIPDMVTQFKNPEFFAQHQEMLRSRETFPVMQDSGLAITGMEGEALTAREEAFRSNLAEKIPVIGKVVMASERGYVGFLNDLRANVFDTQLQLFKESGLLAGDGGAEDKKLLRDLAEWINTSTGRGKIGKWDPGVINTVLFSPRLAMSRVQTFNPQYYWKLSPPVRQAALKANFAAAGIVLSLVSLAKLGGAQVTWDFRNSDAGKIRIGNTRIDLGGGHMQMLRFLTQIITAQKVNSETGKVTTLGQGQAWDQSRFDLLVNFLVSKEAPVASLVTDILKGKSGDGKPITWWNEVATRVVPLAIQDAYGMIGDLGPTGLVFAPLAFIGTGIQTYSYNSKVKIPFLGVNGVVPQEQAAAFEQQMMKAETDATQKAMSLPSWGKMSRYEQEKVLGKFVEAYRKKAKEVWIRTNAQAYAKAAKEQRLGNGTGEFPLTAPAGETTNGE